MSNIYTFDCQERNQYTKKRKKKTIYNNNKIRIVYLIDDSKEAEN